MKYFVVLIVFAFVCGVGAQSFADRNDLKAAVENCLGSIDATGQSCDMNSWDVSSVTDMTDMFFLRHCSTRTSLGGTPAL